MSKESARPWNRLMAFAKPHKTGFVASTVLAVLGVFFGMLPYFSAAQVIVLLIGGEQRILIYALWCLLAGIGFVLKAIFMNLSTTYSHKATFAVMSEVRFQLVDKLAKLPMGYVLDHSSGELKTTIVERIDGIEVPLAHIVPEMTANILVPVSILAYIAALDVRMALISLVTIPLGCLCYFGMMRGYKEKYAQMTESAKYMSNMIVEYINGIEVIKVFNQSARSYQKFTDAVKTNTQFVLNWVKSTLGYSSLMMSIWPAVLVGVLPVGGILYLNGSLGAGEFITIITLSLGIAGPFIGLVNCTDDLSKISTTVNDIGTVLDEAEMVRESTPKQLSSYDIEFKDVVFCYKEEPALKGITLTMKAGELTALVGPSGSGKSTITKLLASFWDVSSGLISIGGIPLAQIPMEQLMDTIAYVSQDNFLFNESIRENIRMGNTKVSNQEVETVGKASGCHAFIMDLEQGYDTVAGNAGGQLSGGERQRIAIARAMLKNSKIVILDEATSFTDPENEAVIQDAVAKLVKGKTLIVIAHRLSTIINSDKIVVVKGGMVDATGTHDELLASSSLYKSMWQAHEEAKDKL